MEKLRQEAEELAKQRRQAREEALAWTAAAKAAESDDEKEKRPRKAGPKKGKGVPAEGAVSGDEVADAGEKKRKRKGRVKKASPVPNAMEEDRDEEVVFSGGEDGEDARPKKVC